MNATPQALPPTTKAALREELTRVRAQLAEEMRHLGDDNMRLRQVVAFLLLECAEKTTIDLWDDDLASMTGRLEMEPSPDRRGSTRITYARPGLTPHPPQRKSAAPADDPWAPNPLIKKLDTFRCIVTEHVVRALLDADGINSSEWARRLTFALEDEGIDLTDAIRTRINDLTLGRNPSDPPF